MKLLIIGVSGFIGSHIYQALSHHGHRLIGCSRYQVSGINWRACDFNQSAQDWERETEGIDIVINAAGIFHQTANQTFLHVHDVGPKRLFDVCRQKNIRVLQISAIGVEQEKPVTEFLRSKRFADQYLLESDQANIVLYPGIVIGEQGATTRQLAMFSRLWVIPMLFNRNDKLPLISIYQLCETVVELVNNWPTSKQSIVLLGKDESMQGLMNGLRQWMGKGEGHYVYLPLKSTKWFFKLFPKVSFGSFTKESVDMLSAYSEKQYIPITDESAVDSLRKYKPTDTFLKGLNFQLLFYINLILLGLIWIMSGLVSMINLEQSRELVGLVGIDSDLGDVFIFGGAVMDIALGVLMWFSRLRRWVIYLQIIVMVVYSIIISIFLPVYWLHPFAPVIKNFAVLMMALYILTEEKGKKYV